LSVTALTLACLRLLVVLFLLKQIIHQPLFPMKTKSYSPTSKEPAGHSHHPVKSGNNIPNILTAELLSSTLETESSFENPESEAFPLPLDRIVDIGKVIEPGTPFSINIGLDSVPPVNLKLNAQGNPEIDGTSEWKQVKDTLNTFEIREEPGEPFRIAVSLIANDDSSMQIILVGTVPTFPDDNR
jgi:hypothetical protein